MGGGKLKRVVEHENPMRRDTGSGILLSDTSDINITGNSFSGLSENAVEAVGECGRLIISSNLVTDIHRRSVAKKPAFNLGKAYASGIVKDNIVQ